MSTITPALHPPPIDAFISRLTDVTGKGVKRSGSGFAARCPAHEDKSPSLSVSEGDGGAVLVHCHAGCDLDAILAALELTAASLFPPRSRDTLQVVSTPAAKSFFVYTDEEGTALFRVVREDLPDGTKKIWQQRATETGGWARGLKGVRRVIYKLPAVLRAGRAGAPIFVVEGEKCAEVLATHGLVATTNPMGAGKWDDAYAEAFRGADVVVLPDNDEPGRDHAEVVVSSLARTANRVARLELDGLDDHGDVADWLAAGHQVDDLLARAREALVRTSVGSPEQGIVTVVIDGEERPAEKIDPDGPLYPWPELDRTALYGPLGRYAEAIEGLTEADTPLVLTSLITGVGAMLGKRIYTQIAHDDAFPVLFTLAVGPTAEGRKGTAWSVAKKPLEAADPKFLQLHSSRGLASGEGLISRLKDAEQPTFGEVDRTFDDRRLMVVETEFGRVLATAERRGNTLSAVIRQGWDNDPLEVLTRNDPLKASEHHIGFVGHITLVELQAQLAGTTYAADGFLNRFLMVATRRPLLVTRAKALPTEPISVAADEIGKTMAWVREVTRRGIDFTDDAWELWDEFYTDIETRTLPGLVGPLARRLTSMAKRVAVVFAAMDRTEHITAEQFQAAVAIVNYGVGSLLHCFGASTGDPDADRLLRAVRAARREGMSRTEIYDLFDRNLTAGEVNLMVERLVDAGLVVQAKVPTGGAPRRVVIDARLAGQP